MSDGYRSVSDFQERRRTEVHRQGKPGHRPDQPYCIYPVRRYIYNLQHLRSKDLLNFLLIHPASPQDDDVRRYVVPDSFACDYIRKADMANPVS
ncbi:hypothetical protein D3C71_1505040 [compost metagenome]